MIITLGVQIPRVLVPIHFALSLEFYPERNGSIRGRTAAARSDGQNRRTGYGFHEARSKRLRVRGSFHIRDKKIGSVTAFGVPDSPFRDKQRQECPLEMLILRGREP